MADSRLSFLQVRQALDNLAWAYRAIQAKIDGGFTGEGTNTLLYALRYLVETRMRAWTSDSAISDIVPSAVNALKVFDTTELTGSTRFLVPVLKGIISGITSHQSSFDTTYPNFWAYWKANMAASPNDKVLGEVADMMVAAGMSVDPEYCVPPAHVKLATITFSGAGEATITPLRSIDTSRYHAADIELYCVSRAGVPDEIELVIKDTLVLDGETDDFDVTVADSIESGNTVDVTPVEDVELSFVSAEDATLEITGGKDGDVFILRTKEYRAPAV